MREVDPYNLKEIEATLREELAADAASVIIAKAPCVLEFKVHREPWHVDTEACTGCKRCLRVGCIALNLVTLAEDEFKVEIDPVQCNGCGVCAQMCNFDAIKAPSLVKV